MAGSEARQERIDGIYNRMVELREQYQDCVAVLGGKVPKGCGLGEEAVSDGLSQRRKPKALDQLREAGKDDRILLLTIREAIRKENGSCHMDVVLRHVKAHWEQKQLGVVDGDFVKKVKAVLHDDHNDGELFLRDPFRKRHFIVSSTLTTRLAAWDSSDCVARSKGLRYSKKTQAYIDNGKEDGNGLGASEKRMVSESIHKALDAHEGSAKFDEIFDYVTASMRVRPDGTMPTHEQVKVATQSILTSSSLFAREKERGPGWYRFAKNAVEEKKRRAALGGPRKSKGSTVPTHLTLRDMPARTRKRKRVPEDPPLPPHTHETGTQPPTGYQCDCGNDWDDRRRHERWKKIDGDDEWSCPSCAHDDDTAALCAVCRKADGAGGEWICCDTCNQWVHCNCDGITDVTLYDDEINPSAEKYLCPKCRIAKGVDGPRASKRKRSEPQDEDVTALLATARSARLEARAAAGRARGSGGGRGRGRGSARGSVRGGGGDKRAGRNQGAAFAQDPIVVKLDALFQDFTKEVHKIRQEETGEGDPTLEGILEGILEKFEAQVHKEQQSLRNKRTNQLRLAKKGADREPADGEAFVASFEQFIAARLDRLATERERARAANT